MIYFLWTRYLSFPFFFRVSSIVVSWKTFRFFSFCGFQCRLTFYLGRKTQRIEQNHHQDKKSPVPRVFHDVASLFFWVLLGFHRWWWCNINHIGVCEKVDSRRNKKKCFGLLISYRNHNRLSITMKMTNAHTERINCPKELASKPELSSWYQSDVMIMEN